LTGFDEIASQLLDSNFSYQHLIEGNLPELGLSYPDQPLVKFDVKRDNHRVAEQARRDRMKKALQDLAELLSQDSTTVGNKGQDAGHVRASAQSSDRVTILETAAEHIRNLQRELEEIKGTAWDR
jgi:hypothetical protein